MFWIGTTAALYTLGFFKQAQAGVELERERHKADRCMSCAWVYAVLWPIGALISLVVRE